MTRSAARGPEGRQLELFGEERRTVRVEVRLTSYEVWRLDSIAALHGVSRSEALRESIGWLAARYGAWAERAWRARVQKVVRDAEAWDPVSDFLAGGGERQPAAAQGDGAGDAQLAAPRPRPAAAPPTPPGARTRRSPRQRT